MVLHRCVLKILPSLSVFPYVRTVEGRAEHSQSSAEISPCLNRQNHATVRVLPMALWPRTVLSTSCVSDAVFSSMKQNLAQICCSNQQFENRVSHFTRTTVNSYCEAAERVMAAKLTGRTKKHSDSAASKGKNVYYLPFSVLAALTVGLNVFQQYINDIGI